MTYEKRPPLEAGAYYPRSDKLRELAAKCEAQAERELADILSALDRMNDNARANPMNACGSGAFANIGGLYALAEALRARAQVSA